MQLDATASREAKEQGMQAALGFSGDWSEEVLNELRGWLAIKKAQGITLVTVESFRATAKTKPASNNAWGSLPRLAMKAGLIEPHWIAPDVQMRVKAASIKTHAHEVKVWRLR